MVYVMFLVQRESDCCLMPNEQFSAISWREQVKLWLDEMTMMSTLYYTNMLSCIFIVFTPWLLADMLLLWTHLSWFRTNQSLLLFLKVVCLAQKQQKPILVFGLTQLGLKPQSTIWGGYANHYTTNVSDTEWDNIVYISLQRATLISDRLFLLIYRIL